MSSSRRSFFRDLAVAARDVARDVAAPSEPAVSTFSDAELERYSRQLVLPEFGRREQVALRDASVLVIGAGALGSPVAAYLVGAGVGRVGIAGHDEVELSNLHRQLLHDTPDVGTPKAQSAAAKLRLLNPEVIIEAYQVRVEPANVRGLVADQDLVVDCSDSFPTRYCVNAACCEARVPLVEGGVLGTGGLVMAIRPGETACYRCAFPAAPPEDAQPTCAEAGVLGPAAGVIGSLQALEAIRMLADLPGALAGHLLQVELAGHAFVRVAVTRRPDCPDCGAA